MKILAYINTYGRTETTLPLTILSIINQTYKPTALVIFDDNEQFKDPRLNPTLKYLLELSMQKGIQWHWLPGQKKGAHFNHEKANQMGYDLNWFLDDDQVAEPDVLGSLLSEITSDVGAVGGLIYKPFPQQLPNWLHNNKIDEIYNGQNIQWYIWVGKPCEVEHIYSSFLYRPNISHWDLRLSRKTFRGETMFTHNFFLKGYKLIVTPDAITWHFESSGGCRSVEQDKTNQEMYNNDDQIFRDWLSFKRENKKLYVLNGGLGDHYMFLQTFPLEKDAIYAVCYPEPFKGYTTISIAEADKWIDKSQYDVYEWANNQNFKGDLRRAYKYLYEHINQQR